MPAAEFFLLCAEAKQLKGEGAYMILEHKRCDSEDFRYSKQQARHIEYITILNCRAGER